MSQCAEGSAGGEWEATRCQAHRRSHGTLYLTAFLGCVWLTPCAGTAQETLPSEAYKAVLEKLVAHLGSPVGPVYLSTETAVSDSARSAGTMAAPPPPKDLCASYPPCRPCQDFGRAAPLWITLGPWTWTGSDRARVVAWIGRGAGMGTQKTYEVRKVGGRWQATDLYPALMADAIGGACCPVSRHDARDVPTFVVFPRWPTIAVPPAAG